MNNRNNSQKSGEMECGVEESLCRTSMGAIYRGFAHVHCTLRFRFSTAPVQHAHPPPCDRRQQTCTIVIIITMINIVQTATNHHRHHHNHHMCDRHRHTPSSSACSACRFRMCGGRSSLQLCGLFVHLQNKNAVKKQFPSIEAATQACKSEKRLNKRSLTAARWSASIQACVICVACESMEQQPALRTRRQSAARSCICRVTSILNSGCN
jgi:hypothetical protein